MHTFKFLLLREWMQHHRGWFLLGLLPLALALLSLTFGQVQVDEEPLVTGMLLGFGGGYIGVVMAIALLAAALQSPSSVRRDWNDRSIEFWVSLPVPHWQAVAATQLAQLLLFPLLALALAMLGAVPVAALFTARVFGAAELLQLPWGTVLLVMGVMAVRLAIGLLLGMLWLSPVIMAVGAATAWLKGWGAIALIATVAVAGGLLVASTGNPIVFTTLQALWLNALAVMVPWSEGTLDPVKAMVTQGAGALPALAWADLGARLRDLGQPLFWGGVVVAAGGFWLQVRRRSAGV
jgi:ABC-2 type transport system permease protein